MTIYLLNREEYDKFLKRLEIEEDEAFDASRTELYTATTQLAIDRPDLFMAKLSEVRADEWGLKFVPASELDSE